MPTIKPANFVIPTLTLAFLPITLITIAVAFVACDISILNPLNWSQAARIFAALYVMFIIAGGFLQGMTITE